MKNIKTFIVLFEVASGLDSRRCAERVESHVFDLKRKAVCETVMSMEIALQIKEELEMDEDDFEGMSVYSITDFMDLFNDEEINPDEYFISYVHGRVVGKP